jgi:Outer membrane lipoprotein-sorting protein
MSVISKAGTGFAVLAASALVLSGCAAAEEPAAEEPAADETTEESAAAEELSLKIGTALPVTGKLFLPGTPGRSRWSHWPPPEYTLQALGLSLEVLSGDWGGL